MTVLDDRPGIWIEGASVSHSADGEWHAFIDGLAHWYPLVQLRADWPPLLTPGCEEGQVYPLRHDRESVTRWPVRPIQGLTCPGCECRALAATREALRAQGLVLPRGSGHAESKVRSAPPLRRNDPPVAMMSNRGRATPTRAQTRAG